MTIIEQIESALTFRPFRPNFGGETVSVQSSLLADARAALVELNKRPWIDGEDIVQGEHEADCSLVGVTLEAFNREKARADTAEARETKALADVAALRAMLAKLVKCDVKWRADIEASRAEFFAEVDGLLAANHPGEGWASPAEVNGVKAERDHYESRLREVERAAEALMRQAWRLGWKQGRLGDPNPATQNADVAELLKGGGR